MAKKHDYKKLRESAEKAAAGKGEENRQQGKKRIARADGKARKG